MSKKSFRSKRAAPEEPSASYPTWEEASSRRSFLATMGKAAAGGILASLAMAACGDNRSVKEPDGGPQQNYSDGVPPRPDNPPVYADSGAAPMPDVPWPKPPDVGPTGPDVSSGIPDQAPAPPDMWPQFSDGLPSQPDVYWPPPSNDAGGSPMPPAPKDEK